jgi:phosphate transport system protein
MKYWQLFIVSLFSTNTMSLPTRSLLDRHLSELQSDVLRLASLVDEAIAKAMEALADCDVLLAQEVIAGDDRINEIRHKIEEDAQLILSTQQPLARDLRTIIAAIHIATELERMGDHAEGIARLVKRMEGDSTIAHLPRLPKMTNQARQMLQDGIRAFANYDSQLALALVRRDDKLDKHYKKLFGESLASLAQMSDTAQIRAFTYMLWIGHNLERIGDRATNIAERVLFMTTGRFTEITEEAD